MCSAGNLKTFSNSILVQESSDFIEDIRALNEYFSYVVLN